VYHFGEAYPPGLDRDEMPRTAVYEMAYRIIPREGADRVRGQIPAARYFALDGGKGLYFFILLCTFALHKRA